MGGCKCQLSVKSPKFAHLSVVSFGPLIRLLK